MPGNPPRSSFGRLLVDEAGFLWVISQVRLGIGEDYVLGVSKNERVVQAVHPHSLVR